MFLIYFKGEVIPPPYARNNIDKVKNNSIKYRRARSTRFGLFLYPLPWRLSKKKLYYLKKGLLIKLDFITL